MKCSPRGTTLSFTFILSIAWKQSIQILSISRIFAGGDLWEASKSILRRPFSHSSIKGRQSSSCNHFGSWV